MNDKQDDHIASIGNREAMEVLERFGIIELNSDDDDCQYGGEEYKNLFEMFRDGVEESFTELQNKVKKLEELTGYKVDDYGWETTTVQLNGNEPEIVKRKLVKK